MEQPFPNGWTSSMSSWI
ncbi:hypothetical protein CAEBREN_00454 [Caenorhabditis brenneri]|uniref:Uncharacterized protein n=1 Tax=Caenorhabditis brenneri TaxID=135651 RepID=G0PIX6_CAEBE|nr:hypothetical protein CAEBREN_00454 [Caenorhabditis brenneri]